MVTTSRTEVGKSQSTEPRWGTYATERRPSRTGRPRIRIRPAAGRTSPRIVWIRVVFPAPFGPTMAVRAPARKATSTSQRTGCSR
jgi:hypothetical protein